MHAYESRKLISIGLKSIIRINIPKVLKLETKLKISLGSKGVPVKVFDKSNNLIKEFTAITNAAKYFGVSIRTIGWYLDKDKSYKGYIFKSNLINKQVRVGLVIRRFWETEILRSIRGDLRNILYINNMRFIYFNIP